MDEANTPSLTGPGLPKPDLGQEVSVLRYIITLLLALVACLAVGVSWFAYHQVRLFNRHVTESKKVVEEFKTNGAPRIQAFVEGLQTFARTNPDFNPILAKYNLLSTTSAPPRTAVPAAPAVKK